MPKENKNKKKLIGIIVAILMAVSLMVAGLFLSKDAEKESEKLPTVNEDLSSRKELKEEKVEDKYKDLVSTLNYEVLRAEQISQLDTEQSLFLDVKVEKQLTNDELKNIGVEAHKKLSKDIKGKDGLVTVFLNVFTSKEAFETTQTEDYKGEFVQGYVQSFVSSSDGGTSAIMNTYTDVSLTKDIKELDSSLNFDIVNTNSDTITKAIQLDVVITDGTDPQVNDLFQSLIEMVKESNDDVDHVSIRAFTSSENYKSGKNTYEYSTLYPSNLTKRVDIQF